MNRFKVCTKSFKTDRAILPNFFFSFFWQHFEVQLSYFFCGKTKIKLKEQLKYWLSFVCVRTSSLSLLQPSAVQVCLSAIVLQNS